jgi:hypothetical protein
MALFTKDKWNEYKYSAELKDVKQIGVPVEESIVYRIPSEKLTEITKQIRALLPGVSLTPSVFKSQYNGNPFYLYEWKLLPDDEIYIAIDVRNGGKFDVYASSRFIPKEKFKEFVGKVKKIFGESYARPIAEISVAKNMPLGMFSKEVSKYLGGKKTRKSGRKARKTRRRL